MLFDPAPPDTSVYMIAGYSIFAIITVIYLASLFIRARNLRRDLDTLEGLEAEAEPPAPAVAPMPARAKPKPGKTKSGPSRAARKRASRKR